MRLHEGECELWIEAELGLECIGGCWKLVHLRRAQHETHLARAHAERGEPRALCGRIASCDEVHAEGVGEACGGRGGVGTVELNVMEPLRLETVRARVGAHEAVVANERRSSVGSSRVC